IDRILEREIGMARGGVNLEIAHLPTDAEHLWNRSRERTIDSGGQLGDGERRLPISFTIRRRSDWLCHRFAGLRCALMKFEKAFGHCRKYSGWRSDARMTRIKWISSHVFGWPSLPALVGPEPLLGMLFDQLFAQRQATL